MNLDQINERLIELKTTAGKIRINKNIKAIFTNSLTAAGVWNLLDGVSCMRIRSTAPSETGILLSAMSVVCFVWARKSAFDWHMYQQIMYRVKEEQKRLKKEKSMILK